MWNEHWKIIIWLKRSLACHLLVTNPNPWYTKQAKFHRLYIKGTIPRFLLELERITHYLPPSSPVLRHSPVMAAPVALIQGSSRGLGLEFCRHILRNKAPAAVIATCRDPDGAAELRGLEGQHPGRLTVLRLDVSREEDIRGAALRVKESFGRLDLIVNSSAMLHPSGRGETSLRDVSAQVQPTCSGGSSSSPTTSCRIKVL